LRIGVDARPLATPGTGIGRYLTELLRRLTTLDHEWILYSDRRLHLPDDIAATFHRHGAVRGRALSTVFSQFHFSQWASQDRLDVFWSPRHHLPLTLNVPSAVTIHDLVWRKVPTSMIRFGRLSERLLMPSAIARAARILVPSHSTARDLAEHFPEAAGRVRVVPLAADLVRRNVLVDEPLPAQPYMLVVGTIEPRKNHDRILDAFATVASHVNMKHRLVVVGAEGWKSSEVMQRLRRQHDGFVTYTGAVGDEMLAFYYANADFVVAPSLYEGFGLQVLEAMSFGKPVITSNISSMPEVAGQAALLVDPYSVSAIADAMRTLIENRTLHARLCRRGLERATDYSWDMSARATLTVLEEISGSIS
jgi:glycosyltransferase involved in cell wall biosynthesis